MTFRNTFVCWLAGSLLVTSAAAQSDDFNDGDDNDWVRFDPLGDLGAGPIASYLLEDGTYRISSSESPNPGAAGASRAGSLRPDVIYQDRLFLSVNLKIPEPDLKQSVGFLFMVQANPSLGNVAGYTFNYQPAEGDLIINRIENEQPIRLAITGLDGVPGEELRLVMIYENGNFTGLLFNLDDLSNPIARITATDSTYTSGTTGLFVFADTDDSAGGTDVIFDNYEANALITPEPQIKIVGGGSLKLTWPDWAVHYRPAFSPSLAADSWEFFDEGSIERSSGMFQFEQDLGEVTRSFFRLEEKPL